MQTRTHTSDPPNRGVDLTGIVILATVRLDFSVVVTITAGSPLPATIL